MVLGPRIPSRFQAKLAIQVPRAARYSLSVLAEHLQGLGLASGLNTTAVEHEWFVEHEVAVVWPAIQVKLCVVTSPAHSILAELQLLHNLDHLASSICFAVASADL